MYDAIYHFIQEELSSFNSQEHVHTVAKRIYIILAI